MPFMPALTGSLRNLVGFATGKSHREVIQRLKGLEKQSELISKKLLIEGGAARDKLKAVHDRLSKLDQRLARFELRVGEVRSKLDQRLARFELRVGEVRRDVKATLRLQALAGLELPYPQVLQGRRFGVLSQNEEDGIQLALISAARPKTRRFIEIGCGSNGGNSGFLASELGWHGLMIDADSERVRKASGRFAAHATCICSTVDRQNVNALISESGFDDEIDFLSIDIDGNDYWIWEALEACRPRIVAVEYNSLLGPDRALVVPY